LPKVFPERYYETAIIQSFGDDSEAAFATSAFNVVGVWKYSRTSLNPYLSVDTSGYGLWGVMGWERYAENGFEKS
jgi:hypothetical protein